MAFPFGCVAKPVRAKRLLRKSGHLECRLTAVQSRIGTDRGRPTAAIQSPQLAASKLA